MASARKSIPSAVPSQAVVRSHVESNRQLLEAFETYLISLNRSADTRRAYLDAVGRFIEALGSKDAAEADAATSADFRVSFSRRV